MLTKEDIRDRSYNPTFALTDEVKGIFENVFRTLDTDQDGRISRDAVVALVLANGTVDGSREDADRAGNLAHQLMSGQETYTFEEFCVIAMQWKEMCPESVS